jgi:hypothetical protein
LPNLWLNDIELNVGFVLEEGVKKVVGAETSVKDFFGDDFFKGEIQTALKWLSTFFCVSNKICLWSDRN